MIEFEVEEAHLQSLDAKPAEHLLDELEQRALLFSGRLVTNSHKHIPKPYGKPSQKS